MKLQISASGQGPRIFVERLADFLCQEYDVVMDKKAPDVYLSSVWRGNPPKGAIAIHRLDGVYFNKDMGQAKSLNKRIHTAVRKADGVVYQSEYCRQMCKGILGISKPGVIIHNGFDSREYTNIKREKKKYRMLVACAKWRSLKRPRSIAKGFLVANPRNTKLIMIGEIEAKDRIQHPNIVYTGPVNTKQTYKYYVNCDGLIHISRLDACPNVVIEALAAGKPILCNNVGGTPEIVKNSGVVVKIDPPLTYKRFSMGQPDRVSPHIIAAGIKKLLSRDWNIVRPDLSMKRCADKYYSYFLEKLNSR